MTPEQIQRRQTAWTVLRYEREMYEATWNLIRTPLHAMFSHHVVNAIVESHSLHLRNLCNFLVGSPGDDELDYTDLVERFEEVDIDPLNKVWYTPIEGHPGSPAYTVTVMSDCTIHRRDSYNYSSIADALHDPLVALMDQIEKVRTWELIQCQHEFNDDFMCVNCGASKRELIAFDRMIPKLDPEAQHETTAEEPCEEGGEEAAEPSSGL